jgi:cell division protein FtsB
MKQATSLILLSLTILILFFAIAGNNGFLQLNSLEKHKQSFEAKNNSLKTEISNLENDIYAVKNSPEVLETKARDELGLSRPGEIIYTFPEH